MRQKTPWQGEKNYSSYSGGACQQRGIAFRRRAERSTRRDSHQDFHGDRLIPPRGGPELPLAEGNSSQFIGILLHAL